MPCATTSTSPAEAMGAEAMNAAAIVEKKRIVDVVSQGDGRGVVAAAQSEGQAIRLVAEWLTGFTAPSSFRDLLIEGLGGFRESMTGHKWSVLD